MGPFEKSLFSTRCLPICLTATCINSQETAKIHQISKDVHVHSHWFMASGSARSEAVWSLDTQQKKRGKWNHLRVLHHQVGDNFLLPFSDTSFCLTWPPSFAREEGTTMRWRISWTSTTSRWQTTPPLTESAKRSVGRKYGKKYSDKHAALTEHCALLFYL